MAQVRDRLWLWAHEAGTHHAVGEFGLPTCSRITPLEAAVWFGVPNLIMVRTRGRPAPPYRQFALPLRVLDRVVWSVVGSAGEWHPDELEHVLALRPSLSNLAGVIMDDFFHVPGEPRPERALGGATA
ncbi:MAG: hypothetical protein AB1716_09350 [Planctomycetota bacterium]